MMLCSRNNHINNDNDSDGDCDRYSNSDVVSENKYCKISIGNPQQ